ncbi:hypothetical protein [Pelagicoccus sp. SDUM812003]|uniref:hypothetical protein n=1 Tax=Pelagicoccus sp. SDUM812003 TaxID=3041267 RepID=UPI00280E4F8C|nr:hypothetical protein [Pelagicoccus sp. SDUM812003]MDQ8205421.1 hypothetical protein [Pelagicoccus sp. SDUM812003]
MQKADESPLTIDEIATRLKCSRGWVQLSIDAGCPVDSESKVSIRDFMLFQLTNIHRIRELAGLPPMQTKGSSEDLRPNVKAILSTQLEWLQVKSTRSAVKTAAKLVYDRINALNEI